jgi:hypothetical protein
VTRPTAKRKEGLAGFGPTKKRRRGWAKKGGKKPDLRAKTVKEKISISFSFPNISNTLSNDFCNHFLLKIKTNHTNK